MASLREIRCALLDDLSSRDDSLPDYVRESYAAFEQVVLHDPHKAEVNLSYRLTYGGMRYDTWSRRTGK